jgi:hypothetical protein
MQIDDRPRKVSWKGPCAAKTVGGQEIPPFQSPQGLLKGTLRCQNHSAFMLLTGFIKATFMVCERTVINAIKKAIIAVAIKITHFIFTR